jgi:hypothetical protein
MYEIQEDELLIRVQKYDLLRKKGGRIPIDVCRTIAGEPEKIFIAVPRVPYNVAKTEYTGKGDTEDEALQDCLRRIKGVPVNEIFSDINLANKYSDIFG